MANLSELNQWDAGIYRLETTDPAEGGEAGKANAPLKNLANRTVYLKSHVDALEAETGMSAHVAAADPHPGYVTTAEDAAIMAAHVAAADPHPGYMTTAEDVAIMSAHTAAADPHPGYTTAAELSAAIAAIPGGLGSGQTWQNVSGSRSIGTVYQNTTGKPIMVSAVDTLGANNVSVGATSSPATVTAGPVVIPDSWYYKMPTNGGATVAIWAELRA